MIDINDIEIIKGNYIQEEIFNKTLKYKNFEVNIDSIIRISKQFSLKFIIRYKKISRSYGRFSYYNIPNKYKNIAKELFIMFEDIIILPNKLIDNKYNDYGIYKYWQN